MGSLTKTYNNQKLLGKVYTPTWVVNKILTDVGLTGNKVLGKTILDPSCGDGRFLVAIAETMIACLPPEHLKTHLENIYGWDVDAEAVAHCIRKLDQLIAPLGIQVRWNISVQNALQKILDPTEQKFDFIVGNPPYIRIQHLQAQERKFIQHYYDFCKSGSTDAYIAFFELCNHLLSTKGICGLITPNTFFYNQTAKQLRTYFATNQRLIKITNYGHHQLFNNATTYSAITIFGKQKRDSFLFEQADALGNVQTRIISFQEIKNSQVWRFEIHPTAAENKGVRLKDICRIHVGITTLCDKAYIFTVEPLADQPDYVWANTRLKGKVKMEKAILKPIIKASRLKKSTDPITEYILFPYQKVANKHQIIAEEQLRQEFPYAYSYLQSIRTELDKRDNGKPNPVAWYAFGRSQGLDTSFGKKILFAPMNVRPNFVLVENQEATFYSGYCIKYEGDYGVLLEQLNSQRLANFIAVSSRDFRSGWKAYNKKVLEEFTIVLPSDENAAPAGCTNTKQ